MFIVEHVNELRPGDRVRDGRATFLVTDEPQDPLWANAKYLVNLSTGIRTLFQADMQVYYVSKKNYTTSKGDTK